MITVPAVSQVLWMWLRRLTTRNNGKLQNTTN